MSTSQSKDNKLWIYAAVAGAAVVGGALILHLLSAKEDSGPTLFDEID